MKRLFISMAFIYTLASCSSSEKQKLAKIKLADCPIISKDKAPKLQWSTSDSLSGPESVVYDYKTKSFYVSNVAGKPLEKDGKAWISKINKNGKMSNTRWIEGLNAPKGMRIRNGYIWLSDIDEVKSIQIAKRRISSTIKIPGSKFLNDVVVSSNDLFIYVSDMLTNTVHTIQKNPTNKIFVSDKKLENPNGLISHKGDLLVASWGPGMKDDFSTELPGKILSINEKSKKISNWTNIRIGNLDGIEMIDDRTVLVSDWMAGKLMKVTSSGECTTLLEGFKGSADFTYLPKEGLVVIPLMLENRVVAYKLGENE